VDEIELTVAADILNVELSLNKPCGVLNLSSEFVLVGAENVLKSVDIALACPERTNNIAIATAIHFILMQPVA